MISMKSQIKQKLESGSLNLKEDVIEVSSIKPFNVPKKPNKNDFNDDRGVTNSNVVLNELNEGKDQRLKAINMLRKKPMSKEETNNHARLNLENEPLNKNVYGGNVFI